MTLGPLPLPSSKQVTKALERLGFTGKHQSGRRKKGSSHRLYVRENDDGTKDTCTVTLGRRQLSTGAFASIIRQSGVTKEEFLEAMK